MNKSIAVAVVLVFSLGPSHVSAGKVFINDINIDGLNLKNQELKGCVVKIDSEGSIRITAKDYDVNKVALPPEEAVSSKTTPSPPAKPLTKRYWLVTQRTGPYGAGYDVDIFINDLWLKKIKSKDDQVVFELTGSLAHGVNAIKFAAVKSDDAVVPSPDGAFSLIIGEGMKSNSSLVMEAPLIEYKRAASEKDSRADDFTMEAR